MIDGITADMDDSALRAALAALGPSAQELVNAASHVTATAIEREATMRLRRQLGPHATGATEAGITSRPADNGNGYVVLSARAHDAFSLHRSSRNGRTWTQKVTVSNVPRWIDKGTKRGKPRSHTEPARPFFFISAQLEEGAHARRIAEALQDAINAQGLGD